MSKHQPGKVLELANKPEDEEPKINCKEFEDPADKLTQFKNMGAKGKTAAERVDAMLNMMLELLTAHPKQKDKDIHAMIHKRVLCLQNLKKDKKLDMDTCKTALIDAAQVIKKVNELS